MRNKLQLLASGNKYLLMICVGLLMSNLLLIFIVSKSFNYQQKIIVPADLQSFVVSGKAIDASYLEQMARFFVVERLNVTPYNVEQAHHAILHHVDHRFYAKFSKILSLERETIQKQNISSIFYLADTQIDHQQLKVTMKGKLTRWSGAIVLPEVERKIELEFSYRHGALKITSFNSVDDGGENR
jgi:type IV conjugative transfer system protein TraE